MTTALAVAVPAASASAATTQTVDPTVCQLLDVAQGPFGPTMFLGGASLSATLQGAGSSVGCAPPAAQPSLFPPGP